MTREAIAVSVSRSPVFSMKSILPVNKIYLSFLLAENCVGSCSVVLKDVLQCALMIVVNIVSDHSFVYVYCFSWKDLTAHGASPSIREQNRHDSSHQHHGGYQRCVISAQRFRLPLTSTSSGVGFRRILKENLTCDCRGEKYRLLYKEEGCTLAVLGTFSSGLLC